MMDQRLQFELNGESSSTLPELVLDNCRADDLSFLCKEKFKSLESLSMINCGLESLNGLRTVPTLRILVLCGNRLVDDLKDLAYCTNLLYLDLSENFIKNLEDLECLRKLRKIRVLHLSGNPVTCTGEFRSKILAMLPSLLDFDGLDRDGKRVTESALLKFDQPIPEPINQSNEGYGSTTNQQSGEAVVNGPNLSFGGADGSHSTGINYPNNGMDRIDAVIALLEETGVGGSHDDNDLSQFLQFY